MINIVVINEFPVLRLGLNTILKENLPTFCLTGYNDQKTFLELRTRHLPDLIILVFNRNLSKDDFAFFRQIKVNYKAACIVMFDKQADFAWLSSCFRVGVSGFLTTKSTEKTILDCIGATLTGKKYVCDEIHDFLTSKNIPNLIPAKQLTQRQYEIAKYYTEGLTTSQIAKRLEKHNSTISNTKKLIFKKLEITNLVKLIERLRILSEPRKTH